MGTTPKVPTPPDPRSVVYVIRSDKSGAPLLKIGVTTSLHRRLRELARRTQGPVTLLATWPGDDTLERALHRACSAALERFAGTVRGASPATQILPPWLAVEIHEGLTACGCVRRADGRAYAQGACGVCHGAGVVTAPDTTAARAA